MCDYSLHAHSTRLAQEGERLVVHAFPGGSLGLAARTDLLRTICQSPGTAARKVWQAIVNWFIAPSQTDIPAVCIPPGSQLRVHDIPRRLQKDLCVQSDEEVTFDQISAEAYMHRDCIRFKNGRTILLQRLQPGQEIEVMSLSPAMPRTITLEAERDFARV
jgi:hypothetical protein